MLIFRRLAWATALCAWGCVRAAPDPIPIADPSQSLLYLPRVRLDYHQAGTWLVDDSPTVHGYAAVSPGVHSVRYGLLGDRGDLSARSQELDVLARPGYATRVPRPKVVTEPRWVGVFCGVALGAAGSVLQITSVVGLASMDYSGSFAGLGAAFGGMGLALGTGATGGATALLYGSIRPKVHLKSSRTTIVAPGIVRLSF